MMDNIFNSFSNITIPYTNMDEFIEELNQLAHSDTIIGEDSKRYITPQMEGW